MENAQILIPRLMRSDYTRICVKVCAKRSQTIFISLGMRICAFSTASKNAQILTPELKMCLSESLTKRTDPNLQSNKNYFSFFFSFFFFARIGRSDLTQKLEKAGPFECDELEKHCRVSAKCYPTKVPALYTMTKDKSSFLCFWFCCLFPGRRKSSC